MALAPCRECGNQMSDSATACPHCGYRAPVQTGQLVVQRRAKYQGMAYGTEVFVDDRNYGTVRRAGKPLIVNLPVGTHALRLVTDNIPPMPATIINGTVNIAPKQQTTVEVWAATWGWKAEIL